MKVIKVGLSAESVAKATEQVRRYAASLPARCDEFAARLAEAGVEAAVRNVKMDTGGLESGISAQRKGRGLFCVVSVGDYAVFVEFGTGVVGEGTYEGELPDGWDYDSRQTPEAHDADDPTRWYYYDEDGRLRSTRGQKASSYMARAAEEMRQKVLPIAREVFAL